MKYLIMMFGGIGAATQDRSAEWIAGMHELLMKLDTELKDRVSVWPATRSWIPARPRPFAS